MFVTGNRENLSIQRSLTTENKKSRILKTLKTVQKWKADTKPAQQIKLHKYFMSSVH